MNNFGIFNLTKQEGKQIAQCLKFEIPASGCCFKWKSFICSTTVARLDKNERAFLPIVLVSDWIQVIFLLASKASPKT